MTIKRQIDWSLYERVAVQVLPSRRAPRKSDRTFNGVTAKARSSNRTGLTLEYKSTKGGK